MSYTIIQQAPVEVPVNGRTAWSVTLTVRSSDDLAYPPKVFVFQAEDPANPDTRGWFTAVASPAQLLEYPEDNPAIDSGEAQQPYYRLDSVALVTRNPGDLDEIIQKVFEEVDFLYRNLKALEVMAEPVIMLPVCRASDTLWPGSALLGPYVTDSVGGPTAVRAVVEFTRDDGLVTFDSEAGADGTVTIVDPAAWTFKIPEQPLHLSIGLWDWTLTVTDSEGADLLIYSGVIPSQ